jgi:hypothetical protein
MIHHLEKDLQSNVMSESLSWVNEGITISKNLSNIDKSQKNKEDLVKEGYKKFGIEGKWKHDLAQDV